MPDGERQEDHKIKANEKYKIKVDEYRIVYVQSAANRADIHTKPVAAKVYAVLRDVILNIRRAAVNIHAMTSLEIEMEAAEAAGGWE